MNFPDSGSPNDHGPRPNVNNLPIEDAFDDCQDTIKVPFSDATINKRYNFMTVNGITLAPPRKSCLTSRHIFSLLNLLNGVKGQRLSLFIPTGNFGNGIAEWFAKRMALLLKNSKSLLSIS